MAITTTLEARYVLMAALSALLARLFPGQHAVKVAFLSRKHATQLTFCNADLKSKIAGDFVEVTAPRRLTQVSLPVEVAV
jgi:hypothetical protein